MDKEISSFILELQMLNISGNGLDFFCNFFIIDDGNLECSIKKSTQQEMQFHLDLRDNLLCSLN